MPVDSRVRETAGVGEFRDNAYLLPVRFCFSGFVLYRIRINRTDVLQLYL